MVDKKQIKAEEEMETSVTPKNAIIGTFEGECADSNITNLNGLDITRPVWEAVFASEEYKKGIELGHYIGFLGHPEDPNCMDFEHACIVMTEGRIDNDGKIQGKFNLIDTPVGRIVKTFQDAGVQFGISVRGAGDIIDNSVDPETFVFRGFDLVSFPAYPESIPTFTEIAASSDIETRKKYKAISAAVKKNVGSLNSCEAIDVIQPYFAEQSDEYQLLEDRKSEILDIEPVTFEDERLEGVLDLYLNELEENANLKAELANQTAQIAVVESAYRRKLNSIDRITSAQIADLDKELDRVESARRAERIANSRKISELNSKIEASAQSNLKYKQKIDATRRDLDDRDAIISGLQADLSETVRKVEAVKTRSSNLDAQIADLQSQISAARTLVQEYQDAYASLYASAIGVNLDNVKVTGSTSVKELQGLIKGSKDLYTSVDAEPTPADIVVDDDGLITL